MMMMIKFLLLSLLVVVSVEAGKDLMIKECHNADVPTICMQCLESDPASVYADSVGIAEIIINCLDTNLHTLKDNMTTEWSSGKNETIKAALLDCMEDMSHAIYSLWDAKDGLRNAEYDKAGKAIVTALTFPMKCQDSLGSILTTYGDIFEYYNTQINIYGQLSTAAMRIIDRF